MRKTLTTAALFASAALFTGCSSGSTDGGHTNDMGSGATGMTDTPRAIGNNGAGGYTDTDNQGGHSNGPITPSGNGTGTGGSVPSGGQGGSGNVGGNGTSGGYQGTGH